VVECCHHKANRQWPVIKYIHEQTTKKNRQPVLLKRKQRTEKKKKRLLFCTVKLPQAMKHAFSNIVIEIQVARNK
jgi:hypothetical protein